MSSASKEICYSSLVAAAQGQDALEGWTFEQVTVDPLSPPDGVIWYNITERRLKWRSNGATQSFAHLQDITGGLKLRGGFTTAVLPTAAIDISNPGVPLANGDTFIYNGSTDAVIAGIQGDDTLSRGDLLLLTDAANPTVAASWLAIQRNLAENVPIVYTDLPLGGAIAANGSTSRLTLGQAYNLPVGSAGLFADVFVKVGTGQASIVPSGADKIKGLTTAYTLQAGSTARFACDAGTTNWEVLGQSSVATAGGMEYSNWNTFAVSIAKTRASGETFADYITARIGNTVGLPVEANLTADAISLAIGLGTVAPITLAGVGTKPVVVRASTGNVTYTGTQIVPAGIYAIAYNGIEIVADRLEAAAVAAITATATNLAGRKGWTQRVNTGETAFDLVETTGSLMGSGSLYANLPTTNGDKFVAKGDFAYLNTDGIGTGTATAPQYPIGFYRYDGTAYQLAFAIKTAAAAPSYTGLRGQAQRVNAAEAALEFFTMGGSVIGSAATFATLPTTNGAKAVIAGDWAYLSIATVGNGTTIAPQYPIGFYRYDGAAYNFSFALSSPTATQILDTWFGTANANWDTYGLTSLRQIVFAIAKTQLFLGTGSATYDWNNIYTRLEGLVGFNANAEHANAPNNFATGFSGFATRTGTTADGSVLMFVARGPSGIAGLWQRQISGGTWSDWQKFAGDEWQNATAAYQAVSGARVRVNDGVQVTLAYASTNDAIRIVPKTTWDKVPTILANQSYTVSGQPLTGSEEAVFLPDTVNLRWEAKIASGATEKATAPALTPNETVKPNDLRVSSLNGARIMMHYAGAANRVLPADANTINGLEVEFNNGWRLYCQHGPIPSYIDNVYYPISFEVVNSGNYYRRRIAGISQVADLDDTTKWQPLGSKPPIATGATATVAGTPGLLPVIPAGPVGDFMRRDLTFGPIPTNGTAGTAANVVAADAIEHTYKGSEVNAAIKQVSNQNSAIALYTTDATMVYGATVANGARFAISPANGKIYQAKSATITNRALDPANNPSEWDVFDSSTTSLTSVFSDAADLRIPDSGDTALTSSEYEFYVPARKTNLLSIEFRYNRPSSTHVDDFALDISFLRAMKDGTIPNPSNGWGYRTNAGVHEIIQTIYGGWAFYFRYNFEVDGRFYFFFRTSGHGGTYTNIICHYDTAALHKLTDGEAQSLTNTTPGVIDGATLNRAITARGTSTADLTAYLKSTDAAATYPTKVDLTTEVTARTNADTALGTRVSATEAKNTAQDGAIALKADQSALAAEVTARTNADTAMGAIVQAETTSRIAADTALDTRVTATEARNTSQDAAITLKADQSALAAEITNRTNADALKADKTDLTLINTRLDKTTRTDGTAKEGTAADFSVVPIPSTPLLWSAQELKAGLAQNVVNIPNSTAGGEVYDIPNMPTGGVIGTAADTIDKFSHFRILQSTAGQAIELPSPTNGKARLVTLHNRQGSSANVSFYGVSVPPGSSSWALWSSGAWFPPASPIVTATSTLTGLQRSEYSTTTLAITNADKDYTLTNTLQEGDLLEIQHMFNGNIIERELVWVRVQAGSVQRQFPWADPNNNTHYFTFPNPLTNKFKVRQVGAGSSPSIVSVKVWRDAANGFVVPIGTQVRSTCNVSVNGAAAQTLFGGTSGRLMVVVPAGKMIGTITPSAGLTVAPADVYTGAIEVAVAEGTTSGTVTVTFVDLVSTATTWEVSYGNAGITNTTGTIPVRHPVSSKSLKSISFLCADRRHTAFTAATREATTVIDMTTIRAVTSDSNGWRRINRTLTLEAGADYPFTFDFRISAIDATRRSIGFSVNDTHTGQSNTYGEIRGITATYE